MTSRAHWGKGRLEVYALKNEILEALNSGQTIQNIYVRWREEGFITVSKPAFFKHVKKLRESLQETAPRSSTKAQAQSAGKGVIAPPQNSEDGQLRRPSEFSFNPTPASNEWEDE